jgi:hypothetical protein
MARIHDVIRELLRNETQLRCRCKAREGNPGRANAPLPGHAGIAEGLGPELSGR